METKSPTETIAHGPMNRATQQNNANNEMKKKASKEGRRTCYLCLMNYLLVNFLFFLVSGMPTPHKLNPKYKVFTF